MMNDEFIILSYLLIPPSPPSFLFLENETAPPYGSALLSCKRRCILAYQLEY